MKTKIELEKAFALDAEEKYPIETAEAYERAIEDPAAPVEAFVNLIALYFNCLDTGFASHHHLELGFQDRAWERIQALLDEAGSRFGNKAEISFWREYIPHIMLGDNFPIGHAEQMAMKGKSLIPYMYLFASSGGQEYKEQAQDLYRQVEAGATSKERYVKSVLDSAMLRDRLVE